MSRQLQNFGATQLEVDRMQRAGRENAFVSNQADRDNFYTQLNQDLTNFGTAMQKTGSDMNTLQANEDFLSLLPEISAYGIGIRRKADGGYELYETK
jgi:hypothetical protein